ncbi:hypothetical protein BH23ACT7_BH23ACT7_03900 [soil metagenome]
MRARFRMFAVLLVVAVIAPTAPAAAQPQASPHRSQPPGGVMIGAAIQPRPGGTEQEAVVSLESAIGRRLAAVRVWRTWDGNFPSRYDRWLRDGGRAVFLAVKPVRANGRPIPWRQLANAPAGSTLHREMVAWAQRVRSHGAKVYLTFHHEPEVTAPHGYGTSADFVAAWRRFVGTFRAQGVTNVEWVWNMVDSSFSDSSWRNAALWYPGDAWVDAIGGDGYNWDGCNRRGAATRWRSFDEIFLGLRLFGMAHPTKPLVIPELGSVEDPGRPGRKAAWLADAQAAIAAPRWSQLRAVLYFDRADTAPPKHCRWQVRTSDSSLRAFRALAAGPRFRATAIGRRLAAASLGGQVLDDAGRRVAGATIQVLDPASGRQVVQVASGPRGRYLVPVRPGRYDVRVWAPARMALAPRAVGGKVVAGAATLDLRLPRRRR